MKSIFCLLACCFTGVVQAQLFPAKNYPQDYFGWPVQAKQGLAANFGELRPNHYHMGLDCKTDQHENAPILAAADGYIAKVKIEPSGFGRAIYINHPNGLTTLYAHLNNFYPALEQYITEQQYALQSWKIFLDIPEGLLKVQKGQFIAYSGNTGGSQGPHLHFEIRDTKTDKVLNPLLFGFPVTDNIPPDILRLAIYDRHFSTYEQSPKFIPIKKMGGVYQSVPAIIPVNTDRVSFAISAFDRYTGSTNRNGIYQAVIFDNDMAVCGFQLDSISYTETRYLNAHIDYKLRSSGGPFLQHLSRLPGYAPSVYRDFRGDGVIDLSDGLPHAIRVEVADTEGNTSEMRFRIKGQPSPPPKAKAQPGTVFHPELVNVFDNNRLCFYLPEYNIYDSFTFKLTETATATGFPVFQLQGGQVPVQAKFPVWIRADKVRYPNKMVMHRWWGAKSNFAKAEPMGNWYRASFRDFGNYQLLIDTIPPRIVPVGFTNGMKVSQLKRIVFVVTDETEELENFSAILDGHQWLRFSNDKGRSFIYNMDEHCPPGEHTLNIHVEDAVGNVAEKTFRFTR